MGGWWGGGLAKAAVAAAAAAAAAGGGREIKRSRASGAVAEAADERISFVFGKEVHHSHSYSRSRVRLAQVRKTQSHCPASCGRERSGLRRRRCPSATKAPCLDSKQLTMVRSQLG